MGKLILVRHGQSIWNKQNRFTGWVDISLSSEGIKEAITAGKILKDKKIDIIFTSNLIRSQMTAYQILSLNEKIEGFRRIDHKKSWYTKFEVNLLDKKTIPLVVSEHLNERHYGDLQGLNKDETKKKYGEEKFTQWRRSYSISPPQGESLKNTFERVVPFFEKEIIPLLKEKKTVLISAHGNSLRALIKYLENLSEDDCLNLELETGKPLEYSVSFDGTLNIKSKQNLN